MKPTELIWFSSPFQFSVIISTILLKVKKESIQIC